MFIAFGAITSFSLFWPAIILVAGAAAVLFVFMITIMLFRQATENRKLLHAERMRSLEAGIPLNPPEQINVQAKFMHNAFWISFWIVFGVPSAAFSAASAASHENGSLGLRIVIWIGSALASIAAVVCATILMIHSRGGSQKPAEQK